MPEQKDPKAPVFNPKIKETIAAFKAENSPKNLNDILNELVRSPLLAPAVFDLQGQPAPKARPGRPCTTAQGHQNQPYDGHKPRGQALLSGLQ